MLYRFIFVVLLLQIGLEGAEYKKLSEAVAAIKPPFHYDLKVKLLKGRSDDQNVLLLLYGMGSDNRIADILQTYGEIPDHMISFNFPDAGLIDGRYDPRRTSFGTIQEILPVLYLLKKLVVEGGLPSINLFGFSAGGGALVNTISVLNSERYDLQMIGLTASDKRAILSALQQGVILLDAPLKSIRELNETRSRDVLLEQLGARYRQNGFEPIDSLKNWQGLSLRVLVYFEVPDEALSNRDDALFIERLKTYNAGMVQALKGSNGGHATYHKELWKAYLGLQASKI